MAELLKHVYNKEFIRNLGAEFSRHHADFDVKEFRKRVFAKGWEELELKARMRRITESLHTCLPEPYERSLKVLLSVAEALRETVDSGFEYMLFPDYVELYGQEEFDLSIDALEEITKLASAEFAVRPFILANPKKMMKQMFTWAKSSNADVRRLSSEGCRPRLPWAMALPIFKQEPRPILKILRRLKNDESLYVRRSVANNLNDISKDNPEVVIDIARQWSGNNPETDWLVKHACRGLLKKAHPDALALFGFGDISQLSLANFEIGETVTLGDYLPFGFELTTSAQLIGKLRIEYAIDFMKANGKLARKIFKVAESDYSESRKVIKRRHLFKQFSTRKHYAGLHVFAVLLNGVEVTSRQFELLSPA